MARPVDGVLSAQRKNFYVSVQQPVLCPVVSPVPFVLNVRGQSQKKDGSPSVFFPPSFHVGIQSKCFHVVGSITFI